MPRLRDDERKAIPLERYLVRPARQHGESLVGWTHRFYGANGWDVHPQVLRQLKTAYRRIYGSGKRRQALDFLRTFLGPMARLDPATWTTKWLLAESDVVRGWLSEWTVREVSRMRFCPECLRRWSFHQELWELPGIRACPTHSAFLRDGCPQCGAPLSAEHFRNGFICRCGQYLADGHGLRTRSAWVDFSLSVVAANPEVVPAGYPRSERGGLPIHDLYLLLTVLARTRYKAINLYRKKQGLSQILHCSLTPTLRDMRFLAAWPNNARRFLMGMVRAKTDESKVLLWLEGDALVDHLLLLSRELAPYRNTSAYQEVHRLISQYVPVVIQGKALLVNPRMSSAGAPATPDDFLGWWSELTSTRGARLLLAESSGLSEA